MARQGAGVIVVFRQLSWALAFAAAAYAGHAMAETRTVQGGSLVLTSTSDSNVSIVTDSTLSRGVRISAECALAGLSLVGGETVVVGTSACTELEGLQIAVSPGLPVTVTASGSGKLTIGDLRAPLTASLIGGGDLKAGAVRGLTLGIHGGGDASVGAVDGPANLQLTGGGDVRLSAVGGPLSVKHTGSGDLAIGSIKAEAVDLENSGSGDTLIGGGTIGALHVHMYGSGDLAVAATVAGGEVMASGGGDVKLGRVTGPLARSASGGSDIVVGGSAVVTGMMADVAKAVGQAGDLPGNHGRTVALGLPSMVLHLIMAAVVGVALFLIWRIVRRNGGFGALGRGNGAVLPDRPLHPGVGAGRGPRGPRGAGWRGPRPGRRGTWTAGWGSAPRRRRTPTSTRR